MGLDLAVKPMNFTRERGPGGQSEGHCQPRPRIAILPIPPTPARGTWIAISGEKNSHTAWCWSAASACAGLELRQPG